MGICRLSSRNIMDRREYPGEEWRTDIAFWRYGVNRSEHRHARFVDRDPFTGKGMEREDRHDNGVRWMQRTERQKVREEGGRVLGERSELRINREVKRELATLHA